MTAPVCRTPEELEAAQQEVRVNRERLQADYRRAVPGFVLTPHELARAYPDPALEPQQVEVMGPKGLIFRVRRENGYLAIDSRTYAGWKVWGGCPDENERALVLAILGAEGLAHLEQDYNDAIRFADDCSAEAVFARLVSAAAKGESK